MRGHARFAVPRGAHGASAPRHGLEVPPAAFLPRFSSLCCFTEGCLRWPAIGRGLGVVTTWVVEETSPYTPPEREWGKDPTHRIEGMLRE